MDIYMYAKSSLPKTQSLNLALVLPDYFLEWRLTRFGKELFISNPNKAIDVEEWPICGGGWLEKLYCIYIYIYIYIYMS